MFWIGRGMGRMLREDLGREVDGLRCAPPILHDGGVPGLMGCAALHPSYTSPGLS